MGPGNSVVGRNADCPCMAFCVQFEQFKNKRANARSGNTTSTPGTPGKDQAHAASAVVSGLCASQVDGPTRTPGQAMP